MTVQKERDARGQVSESATLMLLLLFANGFQIIYRPGPPAVFARPERSPRYID